MKTIVGSTFAIAVLLLSCNMLSSMMPPLWSDVAVIAINEHGVKLRFHIISATTSSGGPVLSTRQQSPYSAHVTVKFGATVDLKIALDEYGDSVSTHQGLLILAEHAQLVLTPQTRRTHYSLESNWQVQDFIVVGGGCSSDQSEWVDVRPPTSGLGPINKEVQVRDRRFRLRGVRPGLYLFLVYCDSRLSGARQIEVTGKMVTGQSAIQVPIDAAFR